MIFQDYAVDTIRPLRSITLHDRATPSGQISHWRTLWEYRLLLLGACLLAGALAAILATGIRPDYETSLMIYVEPGGGEVRSLPGLSGTSGKAVAGAEAELIQSRALIAKALANLDWQISAEPAFLSLLRHAALPCSRRLWSFDLTGFRSCLWSSAGLSVVRFTVPADDVNQDFQLIAADNGRFRFGNKRTGVSTEGVVGHPLTIETASGPLTLLVATLHGAPGTQFDLKRRSVQSVLEDVRKNLVVTELRDKSGVVNVALRGKDPVMINGLLSEMAKQYVAGITVRSTQEIDRTRSFVQEQLADARQRMQESDGRYRQFRSGKATIEPGEDVRSNAQQLMTAKAQKLELEQKRADLLVRFTSNHPAVGGVDVQIQNVNNEIRRLSSYIKTLPSLEQESQVLTRELKASTENYESLMNMDRQLGIARASVAPNVSVVDMPALPERPVSDRMGMLAVLGGLAGLLAGASVALWRKATRHGISDFAEVERQTGLPVYVSVPYSRQQEKNELQHRKGRHDARLLAREFPMDPAVESLRHFRAALQFALPQQKNNIVLLTSPVADAGKSFIAANLAVLLGSGNKKVLLIDADLRNGSLQGYFAIDPNSSGLSDVLSGVKGLDGIIHRNVHLKLDFISAGSLRGDSTDLLLQPGLEKILNIITPFYDVVLINGAPVLEASDCLTLGAHAGAIYLVARAGVSTGSQLGETIRRLKQVGLTPKGFILNGAGAGATYGTHGYSQVHRKPSRIQYTVAPRKIELPDTRGADRIREA